MQKQYNRKNISNSNIKCIMHSLLSLAKLFSQDFSDLIHKLILYQQEILKVKNIVTFCLSHLRDKRLKEIVKENATLKMWTMTGMSRIKKGQV